MATRLKTIEYAFPLYTTTVTDAVVTNLTQITLYIPETVVAFRSVVVKWCATDIITATGGTWGEWRTGLRLAAVAYSTVTNTGDIANTGENLAAEVDSEFTSYFTTNWTGTSMTCDLQVYCDQTTGTTLGVNNVSARIYITYEYNDAASTHIKTVYIPMAGATAALTNSGTAATVETNGVPVLDDFLPENSVTIRGCFMLVEANEATNGGTTDFTVVTQVGSSTAQTSGNIERALGSDRYIRLVHNLMSAGATIFSTASAHDWKASTNGATAMNGLVAMMVVTYEFDPTSSTILNSVLLPFAMGSPMGGTTSSRPTRLIQEFWVEEPATITIQKSAFRIYFECNAVLAGLNARGGTMSYQAYTHNSTAICGTAFVLQRLAHTGSGCWTIARGLNTLTVDAYRTDSNVAPTQVGGFLIVNYHSGLHADGPGAHNHTVKFLINAIGATGGGPGWARYDTAAVAPTIPETSYFLNEVGVELITAEQTSPATGFSVLIQRASSDGGDGSEDWFPAYTSSVIQDLESGIRQIYFDVSDFFERWPNDPRTGSNIETTRIWRFTGGQSVQLFYMAAFWYTYHSITFEAAGNVSGYAGDGSAIVVNVHRTDNGEFIGSDTTVAGGDYSLTWYDDVVELYAAAREDDTHVGRSSDFNAS